jgi:hypothetical protein
MKQKSIILTVILFSGFVLFAALLTERYFKLSTIEIREKTLKKETFRRQKIDRKLITIALNDGYFPIVYPVGYRANFFLKLVDDLPPLGGNPNTNHYYGNEGYGLIKYKSDRFGLRNDDIIWDNFNILKNKVLLVGGSSAHGCCVEKEDSLAGNIKGNVFNVALGGNDPHIINSSVNVFTNYVKPETLVVIIFGNNFGSNKKKDLFDNIVSEKGYICGNEPCEKIVQTSINAHKLLISVQEDFGKKKSFLPRLIEYLKITHLGKRIKYIKRSYFSNDLTIVLQKLVLNSKKKCESADCILLFVYIPNSEIYRPNILSKLNRESLFSFLKVHKIQYIDMNKYFEGFKRDDLYAVQGPHLSPKGYKLVADKINQYISVSK